MDQYLAYYNLREDPFRLTPDPAFYYPSQEHMLALQSLQYCMEHREGFCCITGEPGTGKTTVLRIFLGEWQDLAEIALIMTPRLSPEEFLRAVLEDLNVPIAQAGKNGMLKAFREFLVGHAEAGRSVAIVVDEAQDLPAETLEELRLLSNLETDKHKLLQIILIGQPELAAMLQEEKFKQLNQRITVRASRGPLEQPSASDYIKTRLIKAGNSGAVFEEKALLGLYLLSNGVPRMLNVIASRALMVGFLQESRTISAAQVAVAGADLKTNSQAGKEVDNSRRMVPVPSSQLILNASLFVVAVVLLLIISYGIWKEFAK